MTNNSNRTYQQQRLPFGNAEAPRPVTGLSHNLVCWQASTPEVPWNLKTAGWNWQTKFTK
jgi:hypothetical protein